jgi:hypothetical protein
MWPLDRRGKTEFRGVGRISLRAERIFSPHEVFPCVPIGFELRRELGVFLEGTISGVKSSSARYSTKVMKQNGSSFSNTTRLGRVNCQFMVKVKQSQSVSITPSRGTIPSLA